MGLIRLIAFVNLACIALGSENGADELNYIEIKNELSDDVYPTAYEIKIHPYLNDEDEEKQFKFDGEIFIDIKAKGVNQIVMNSKDLDYIKMKYWNKEKPNQKWDFKSHSIDISTEKIYLNMDHKLASDQIYTLHFIYVGQIGEEMDGFYRKSYLDEENNTKWTAYTFFEYNHARRAFPCFDEPRFKATFQLTIVRHMNFKSFSNTRLISTKKINEHTYADTFAQTPIMSTYLLAFLVSEFKEHGNENFFVVARPEYYSQTEYAFKIGQKLLNNLNKYTSIPYYDMGINKIHLAAVPNAKSLAMENWGLVIFNETSLLFEPGVTSLATQQDITILIAHELTHMWFGNLVTYKRWLYIWLSEGFATYFEYVMASKLFPKWNLGSQFIYDKMRMALEVDSATGTFIMSKRSITEENPYNIYARYYITYCKSSSVIRMIRHAMGEEAFHQSLKDYLTEFKYQNTEPEDLLKHWKNHWPEDSEIYAEEVFNSFTEQVGYPLVTIKVSSDGKSMKLSQKRFLLNPEDGSDNSLLYTIPISYTTNTDPDFQSTTPKLYLEANQNVIEVALPKVDWVIANIQQTGFYRVNYDSKTWLNIKNALMADSWSNINPINRAQYVDDLFNLAQAGEIGYDLVFECMKYLETETNVLPWLIALGHFENVEKFIDQLYIDRFAKFIIKIIKVMYDHLGFEEKRNDGRLEILTREKVLWLSCKYGNTDCISKAMKYFDAMNLNSIPLNIRSVVYCTAMRQGNQKHFDLLTQKLQMETNDDEKNKIIKGLGCVKSIKLVKKYLKMFTGKDVVQHWYSGFYRAVYSNQEIVAPLFKFVTKNYDKTLLLFGSDRSVANVIWALSNLFRFKTQLKALDSFIEQNNEKFGERKKGYEGIRIDVSKRIQDSSKKVHKLSEYFENEANNIEFCLD